MGSLTKSLSGTGEGRNWEDPMSVNRNARATRFGTGLCLMVGLAACGSNSAGGPVTRTGTVAAGTPLASPLLAALAGTQGQTSRDTLDGLSAEQLAAALRDSYAVGVDLASLNADTAGADRLIQTALAVGTPLVFENAATLTSYLGAARGGASRQTDPASAAGAAALAAAVGVGAESWVVVVVPGGSGNDVANQMICLGAGATPDSLPTYDDEQQMVPGGGRQTDPPADYVKPVLPGTVDPPIYSVAELLPAVQAAVNAGPASRSREATREAKPAEVQLQETLLTWPPLVWYPNGKSQDFVMHSAVRVQVYRGQGGTKTFLRLIMADASGDQGFYNRGALVWKEDSDKGYFSAYHHLLWQTVDSNDNPATPSFLHYGGYSPQHVEAATSGWTQSSTSFDVDYVDAQNTTRTWTSTATRSFDMRTYRGRFYGGERGPTECHWYLYYVDKDDDDSNAREYYNIEYTWDEMFIYKYLFGADHVRWGVDIARGSNGAKLLPKVQSWWWVPADSTETVDFERTEKMAVWNLYSHQHGATVDHHRGRFEKTRIREFQVNFATLNASK